MSLNRLLKILSKHAGVISISIAMLGLVVAYMQSLYFAHGNVIVANYIVTEVGVPVLWSGALIVALVLIFKLTLLFVLIYTDKKSVVFALALIVFASTLAFFTILDLMLYLIAIPLVYIIKNTSSKASRQQKSLTHNELTLNYILVGLSILLFSVNNFPVQPASVIEYKNNQKIVASVVADKNNYIVAVQKDPNRILKLEKEFVNNYYPCERTELIYLLMHKPIMDAYKDQEDILNICPDLGEAR